MFSGLWVIGIGFTCFVVGGFVGMVALALVMELSDERNRHKQ